MNEEKNTEAHLKRKEKAFLAAKLELLDWLSKYANEYPGEEHHSLLVGAMNGIFMMDALQTGQKPKFHDSLNTLLFTGNNDAET